MKINNREEECEKAQRVAEQLREIWNNHMNVCEGLRNAAKLIEMYGEVGKSEQGILETIVLECRAIAGETEVLLKGASCVS